MARIHVSIDVAELDAGVRFGLHVDDFDAVLARATAAGATVEQLFRGEGHPPTAFCADPFGNGFCLIGPRR